MIIPKSYKIRADTGKYEKKNELILHLYFNA